MKASMMVISVSDIWLERGVSLAAAKDTPMAAAAARDTEGVKSVVSSLGTILWDIKARKW